MHETDQERANGAAEDLRRQIGTQYPDFDLVVEVWDYAHSLRCRVTDPETGKSVRFDKLVIDDQTRPDRARLVLGEIRRRLVDAASRSPDSRAAE